MKILHSLFGTNCEFFFVTDNGSNFCNTFGEENSAACKNHDLNIVAKTTLKAFGYEKKFENVEEDVNESNIVDSEDLDEYMKEEDILSDKVFENNEDMNEIIQDSEIYLEQIREETKDLFTFARRLIKKLKKDKRFEGKCEVKQNVITRWNSSYISIDSILINKRPIEEFLIETRNYLELTKYQQLLPYYEELRNFLRPFTKQLCYSQKTTST